MDPTSPEAIDPPANVLLVHDSHADPDGCRSMCRREERTAELHVAFAGADGEAPPAGASTAKRGLLSVGDVIRASEAATGPDFTGAVAVDAVSDPTDLAAIGTSISQFCEQWQDEDLVVCFDSLDALLRGVEPKTIFEFAYYLNRRLESVGALAHFHLDPTRHEDRIVAAFGDIFDEVVVDESVRDSLPEATDEEVAALLADLDGADERPSYPWEDGRLSEATDEEVERILGR